MDEQQFLKAYDQHADAIFRHCYFRIFDRERAKDLMQETFTRVWKYIIAGEEIKSMKAFLYRTANNLIIDEVRKAQNRPAVPLDDVANTPQEPADRTHEQMQTNIDATIVVDYCKQMEPEQRDVLLMRYVDGLKPKEIAHVIGVTSNVVSVRLHRAVAELKNLMSKH